MKWFENRIAPEFRELDSDTDDEEAPHIVIDIDSDDEIYPQYYYPPGYDENQENIDPAQHFLVLTDVATQTMDAPEITNPPNPRAGANISEVTPNVANSARPFAMIRPTTAIADPSAQTLAPQSTRTPALTTFRGVYAFLAAQMPANFMGFDLGHGQNRSSPDMPHAPRQNTQNGVRHVPGDEWPFYYNALVHSSSEYLQGPVWVQTGLREGQPAGVLAGRVPALRGNAGYRRNSNARHNRRGTVELSQDQRRAPVAFPWDQLNGRRFRAPATYPNRRPIQLPEPLVAPNQNGAIGSREPDNEYVNAGYDSSDNDTLD